MLSILAAKIMKPEYCSLISFFVKVLPVVWFMFGLVEGFYVLVSLNTC